MTETQDQPAPPSPPALPPFSPHHFAWELRIDAMLRLTVMLAVLAAAVLVFVFEAGSQVWSTVAVIAVLAVWLGVSSISARVSQALPRITAAIETDPAAAESMIADLIRRRPLLRWVRLMLYHRLAVLRHREGRFAESATICQAILEQPMGPARQVRPHLLLMLAEARLHFGDLVGTYLPLLELHHTRLGLTEFLQRVALQTRYEIASGQYEAALHRTQQKVELAELMPAPQCGAMHALLATAARHTRRHQLEQWLRDRAELLSTPEQRRQLATT